jgi:hypothetical protein
MIFETKHTLRTSLMKTRLEGDSQQMAQCICSIPCECGRSYIGKTGRPLTKQLCGRGHSLKECLIEKSKLAEYANDEGHRVGWDEARILEIESNSRYRKYKKSAHVSCLTNLISEPSLENFPSGSPL